MLVGGLKEGFSYERLNAAFRYLMDGAELVARQKNRFLAKREPALARCRAVCSSPRIRSGKRATVVGKPEPGFRLALEDQRLEAGEVAMVGDDAGADVAGAQAAGLRGVLVRAGENRPGEEGASDLLFDSFAGLPGALEI